MTQSMYPSIVATSTSGSTLAGYLNDLRDTLNSGHSGTSEPSYANVGLIWLNTSAGTPHIKTSGGDKTLLEYIGGIPPTRTILTTGTAATYTVPTGVKAIHVRLQGAGGGGGGCAGGGAGTSALGGGGAAGDVVEKLIAAPSASYTYTVGAAGAGGAVGANNGSAGGDTTFTDGGSTSMTAAGGGGGSGHTGAGGNTGAAGGAAPTGSTGGDITLPGARGKASTVADGDRAQYGDGANSYHGAGGTRQGSTGAGTNAAGYGAGGSGAGVLDTSATHSGGDGAGGLIIITEYY